MKMQVKCAWCDEFIMEVESRYPDKVSHGICRKCFYKMLLEVEEFKKNKKKGGKL